MEMPGPSASPDKSLEEKLSQWLGNELKKKKLTISCPRGAATEPATMLSPSEIHPKWGNEASPNFHHERGVKINTPRGSNEKMGPRPAAVGKHHRQHRQTSKGPIKVITADPSNFKGLVYEHTSKFASSPMPDVAAQPTSPLDPHSISNSSAWSLMSQLSSPTTPESIQSSSTSPPSSPQSGHPNPNLDSCVNSFQLSFPAHPEHSPSYYTPFNVPFTHSFQSPALSFNTDLHQNTFVPRCASTPCLGISSEAENVPSNNGRPHSMSPEFYARKLSLERYLFS